MKSDVVISSDLITGWEAMKAFRKIRSRESVWDQKTKRRLKIKVGPGPDGHISDHYLFILNRTLKVLRKELNGGSFEPEEVREIVMVQPCGKKRKINIANFLDRVKYHIMTLRLNRHDRLIHPAAVAYRKRRKREERISIFEVVPAIREALKEFPFFLILDVKDFFNNVPDRLVFDMLNRIPVNWVERRFIENFINRRGNKWKGLAQGIAISPILSNHSLYDFDRLLTDMVGFYRRYSDDLILLFDNEAARNSTRRSLTANGYEGLEIKLKQEGHFPDDAPSYLGVQFDKEGPRPSNKATRKFRARVQKGGISTTDWRRYFLDLGVKAKVLDIIINDVIRITLTT